MNPIVVIVFAVLFLSESVASAQTVLLRGTILDPSGAVIPGADVKVSQGDKIAGQRKSDSTGNFSFDLPAGDYRLQVSAADFRAYIQNVRVTPNIRPLSVSLVLAGVNATVDVASTDDHVRLDEDVNLTSTSISGDTIQALPDDDDALLAQLQALAAGSGAAGSAATFVVDGFSNGKVPPRDQIQQIIIDSNVFSAENAGGGPRVQIITRPGTGPWSGFLNANFNDQLLNARSPLDLNRPKKQQKILAASYGGPVIPGKLTLRMNARSVQIEQESTSIVAVTPSGPINQGVFTPYKSQNLNSTGQIFLTESNSLSFAGEYNTNQFLNRGIGGPTLPERATNFKGHNWNFRLSERAIVNPRLTSEIRFFAFHFQYFQLPVTEAIAINVLDSFNSGGAQNRTRRRGAFYNFGNTIRWTVRPTVNLQLGSDFNEHRDYSSSETNYLGVFTFSSLADYRAGHPITFRRTTGDPVVGVNQLEFASFIQADWRANPKLNVGAGLRYQAQQNLHSYHDLGPTFQLAYQPRTGTVIRAGGRVSYQVFNIGDVENFKRQDGSGHQIETVILNPSYPNPYLNLDSGLPLATNASIRSLDPHLAAPYILNSALTWEQNLNKGWRFSMSFETARGVHLIRTRNINAPYPGTPLPIDLFNELNSFNPDAQAAARGQVDRMRPLYPNVGNIYQFESSAESFSKNVGVRLYIPNNFAVHGIGINGFVQYVLGWADDNAAVQREIVQNVLGWAYDNSSPQNQFNWRPEWARSSSDTRHRLVTNLNLRLPRDTSLSFIIIGNSGRPYSLTTGLDNNADESANDRPPGVARNSLTGPGSYNVNANLTKLIPLRKRESNRNASASASGGINAATPQIFGSTAGAIGIPQGPSGNNRPEPKLQFTVSATNLFNNTQLRGYSGVMTSALFGKPTGAAAGRSVMAGLGLIF
jgi:hypothetical protein